MSLPAILAQLLHLLLLLGAALLLPGLLRFCRARLEGRQGPDPWQPARDWMRLLRKQPVLAAHASLVSSVAPYIGFAAVLAAALMVPGFVHGMALAPMGDLVLLAGLLLLARGAGALAALDAGTAPSGRAAARAMRRDGFALPALLLVAMGFAVLTGTTSPDGIGAALQEAEPGPRLALALLLPAILAVALAGSGRLVDEDPVPEASGRHRALWEMQEALRLVLWMALLAGLFLPFGTAWLRDGLGGWLLALLFWCAKLALLALALAVAEVNLARLRDSRLAELTGAAALLALLGVAWLFLSAGVA
ncbi:NADH-quinone oxidoreductase subunit H [Roseomonas marmotae]|uniref:NADH-quinone oxidoreductase subunit H n=1 Tax=Roseomonas marmotae TaxID=2768161 RepID=A0ABS3KB71_9PROT|nr:NADH-quinone oxidoreductase subunit H [Roseomonas marmotae]MBO1073596.1 NADH-quinone oxidoreductase subunit H [Roseomonas marmotae]QTI80223.1 NADH-quinone oxidoreductase subunit H [Roseomonas marmotae]